MEIDGGEFSGVELFTIGRNSRSFKFLRRRNLDFKSGSLYGKHLEIEIKWIESLERDYY